jgi:hypothetical protein
MEYQYYGPYCLLPENQTPVQPHQLQQSQLVYRHQPQHHDHAAVDHQFNFHHTPQPLLQTSLPALTNTFPFFPSVPPGTVHPPPHGTNIATTYHLAPSDIAPPRLLNSLTSSRSFESFSSLASAGSMSTAASEATHPVRPVVCSGSEISGLIVPIPSTAGPNTARRTNWEPTYAKAGDEQLEAEPDLDGAYTEPIVVARGRKGKGRARGPTRTPRAAASKARSNIASIATALRSPEPHDAQSDQVARTASVSSVPTRPAAAALSTVYTVPPTPSTALSYIDPSQDFDDLHPCNRHPAQPTQPAHLDPSAMPALRDPNLAIPIQKGKKSSTMLPLRNHRGYLLPAPPNATLEVNDLLLLHPPALSPGKTQPPMSQYNPAPVAAEGYRSMFEMYTCRVCSKTYDGKNARSVARRHLQDKHGVPLAMQARRTRWDAGESRWLAVDG